MTDRGVVLLCGRYATKSQDGASKLGSRSPSVKHEQPAQELHLALVTSDRGARDLRLEAYGDPGGLDHLANLSVGQTAT